MTTTPLPYPSICRKMTEDTHSETSTEGDEGDLQLTQQSGRMSASISSKLKTSLCKNFIEKGACPYGNRCQFAHGPEELRINMQSNRCYKTKCCYAFAKKGFCYYGERCNFIHQHSRPDLTTSEKSVLINANHRQTMRQVRLGKESRLLGLLGKVTGKSE